MRKCVLERTSREWLDNPLAWRDYRLDSWIQPTVSAERMPAWTEWTENRMREVQNGPVQLPSMARLYLPKKKGRTNPKAVQRSARLLLPPWIQRVQAAVKAAFPSSHGVGHLSRLLKARQPHRTLGRGWLSDGPEDRNDSEDDSSWAFK